MLEFMTQWYSKELGDGMMAYLPLDAIEAEFKPRFKAAGKPDTMAVFKRHELGSGLFCDVTAFFSPAAAEVAKACDAEPCHPPHGDDITLVFGNTNCWTALFNSDDQ